MKILFKISTLNSPLTLEQIEYLLIRLLDSMSVIVNTTFNTKDSTGDYIVMFVSMYEDSKQIGKLKSKLETSLDYFPFLLDFKFPY